MARNRALHIDYAEDLRIFPGLATRVAVVALVVVMAVLPLRLTDDWLQTLSICGCFAIGAIGLNLLTGFTGQVSLGHAFFLAIGGYTAAHIGARSPLPVPAWLLLIAVIGGVVGAAIGPFALRLRGNYLAIITIALLFVSDYLWNRWHWFTGGGVGLQPNPAIKIGPLNFAKLHPVGFTSRIQGVYALVWLVVLVCAVLAKNLVRTRAGRAMQAIRDRDLAAEAIGVSLTRYKVGAFAVSSAMAAVAGALYFGVVLRSIEPSQVTGSLGLVLSIQFVAAIIIGGIGTVHGSIIGAFFVVGVPELVRRAGKALPFIGDGKTFSVSAFSNLLFGVLVVVFLLLEPLGFAALWRRVKTYFLAWPFSY
jgi:branched-chain amino acid transport system permease protein